MRTPTMEERLRKAMLPPVSWKGKALAYQLFAKGLRPSNITPRQVCFIKRRTLYRYYEGWKRLQRLFPELLAHFTRAEAQARPLGLGGPTLGAGPAFGPPAELDDEEEE